MVRVINDKNEFDEFVSKNKNSVILLDFFAEWCGPCKMLTPVLENLSNVYKGQLNVIKIDVDEANELTSLHKVSCMPTLIFIVNGEVLNEYKIEGFSETKLLQNITECLKLVTSNKEEEVNSEENISNLKEEVNELKESIVKISEKLNNLDNKVELLLNELKKKEVQ